MKNILMISHSSRAAGGAEDDFFRLLQYLSKAYEYNLYGLIPKGKRAGDFISHFAKWSYYKEGYFPILFSTLRDYVRFFKYFIHQLIDVCKFIKGKQIDLCIVNVSVLLIPGLVLKFKGIKTLIFIRENIKPFFVKKIIYKYWNLLNCEFICHTKEIRDEYNKLTNKNNITIIRLAVEKEINDNLNSIYPENSLLEFLNTSDHKFICVGPICDLKNQKLILEALSLIIKESIYSPKILFVGKLNDDTQYFGEIQDIIKNNNLENNVMLIGEKPKSFVYYLYTRSQGLVIASKSEGFGLTTVEAMMHKLPVLSTKVGVMPEIIENYKNGIIFNNTPLSLKESMLKIIKNENLRKSIAIEGFRTSQKEFDMNESFQKTKFLIDFLLKNSND